MDSPAPAAECTAVEDACGWLAGRPDLDSVAASLRSLRVAKSELDQVIELLRYHVLVEIGDKSIESVTARGYDPDEEPF